MSSYETAMGQEYGELGEATEFGESGEATEFGEFGEATEFGEFGEATEFGESQEASEQFLGGILGALTSEGGGLNEAQEVELATELLEVSSEAELEQFLGNVFKKVVSGVGKFVRSPVGRALGGVLKSVAKKALPVVGGALGSMVAPGIGTAIGSKLGSLAGGLFEIQTEGMNQEQAEFEVARRVVRLAAASARNAAAASPNPAVNPRTVARAAMTRAARQYAPGIYRAMVRSLRSGLSAPGRPPAWRAKSPYGVAAPVRTASPSEPTVAPYGPAPYGPAVLAAEPAPFGVAPNGGLSGRWVRRGRRIIVIGV
jgi:uncharacterized protein (DUF697 family)